MMISCSVIVFYAVLLIGAVAFSFVLGSAYKNSKGYSALDNPPEGSRPFPTKKQDGHSGTQKRPPDAKPPTGSGIPHKPGVYDRDRPDTNPPTRRP